MFKPSRRALVVAASFALGLSTAGPAAQAGLLGGDDSDTAVEGVGLPVAGDLLSGEGLLGGVLGGEGLLGEGLLGGGPLGLVGGVLGGGLGGEGLIGGGPLGLIGASLGLVGGPVDLLGGVLAGDDSVLAAEGLVEVVEILPLGVVPGGESVLGILGAFSRSGSIVPGLQVLDETGVLGILGSL